jgi:hypothetical protein
MKVADVTIGLTLDEEGLALLERIEAIHASRVEIDAANERCAALELSVTRMHRVIMAAKAKRQMEGSPMERSAVIDGDRELTEAVDSLLDLESLERRKDQRAIIADPNGLRRVIMDALKTHPLPWTVDAGAARGSGYEVTADDGVVIARCAKWADCELIVIVAAWVAEQRGPGWLS